MNSPKGVGSGVPERVSISCPTYGTGPRVVSSEPQNNLRLQKNIIYTSLPKYPTPSDIDQSNKNCMC